MNDRCTEQRFLDDVAQHRMTILRDDSVNRHAQFKREGTRCYQFDLITWPGYLCYTGDMGSYVFQRTTDMFEFFRTDRNDFNYNKDGLSINPGYWGEKLEAVDKCDGFKEFSLDLFRKNVREYLKGESHSKQLWEEIESSLLDVHMKHIKQCTNLIMRVSSSPTLNIHRKNTRFGSCGAATRWHGESNSTTTRKQIVRWRHEKHEFFHDNSPDHG